ncbi:hypothetical protein HK098_000699 [Nowakowskiella sp. JEL0407]|nr:hypothetical protein HK098_000699 [Nowakowskiella sp. JEL0407]
MDGDLMLESISTSSHVHGLQASHEESNLIPTANSLSHLIEILHTELNKGGIDSCKVDVQRIQQIMASYRSNQSDWRQYAQYDPSKPYTRNLVDDGNGHFNLMVLCWGEGKSSPIHDHAGSHCLMKVLSGEVAETQYKCSGYDSIELKDDNEPYILKTTEAVYHVDEVAYIHGAYQ